MRKKELTRRYLHYIQRENPRRIQALQTYAVDNHVPIIKDEMASFLRVLIQAKRPCRILEIGTAIGYSTLVMMEALDALGISSKVEIVTIERNLKMVEEARKNIGQSKYSSKIKQINGDATEILKKLCEESSTFDFIFMDAAKGQYLTFLPSVIELLSPEGVLISDNVLQDGEVVRSRYNVSRRNRTIHQRMRQYLWEINHHPQLSTTVLDLADGVTISIKIKSEREGE